MNEMKKLNFDIELCQKEIPCPMPSPQPDMSNIVGPNAEERIGKEINKTLRKIMIMNRLEEHYNELKRRGYDVAALFLQGSQNYELDEYSEEYQSDIDSKAIVIPSVEDFVEGKAPVSTTIILDNNEHIDVKDVRVMFSTMKKMNISYLELLYTDFYIVNPRYKAEIQALRNHRADVAALNKVQLVKALYGMAMEKKKALCHPYPGIKDKIDKYGYDGKQLSHAVRLRIFLETYLATRDLGACYVPKEKDRKLLMNLKKSRDANGNTLSVDAAVEMMEAEVQAIAALKDEYVSIHNVHIVETGLYVLQTVQHNMMIRKIKEESEELELWECL